jgi:hypothetical protein
MYYVAHKFPNLSKDTIHLGTHSHLIVDRKRKESFQEMKNMVEDEVYRTPIPTNLAIILFMSKTFLFHHLFNEDGSKGPIELLKVKN